MYGVGSSSFGLNFICQGNLVQCWCKHCCKYFRSRASLLQFMWHIIFSVWTHNVSDFGKFCLLQFLWTLTLHVCTNKAWDPPGPHESIVINSATNLWFVEVLEEGIFTNVCKCTEIEGSETTCIAMWWESVSELVEIVKWWKWHWAIFAEFCTYLTCWYELSYFVITGKGGIGDWYDADWFTCIQGTYF